MTNKENECLNQAIFDYQKEMFDKDTFYQSEMAQYLIQLSFEKGTQWKDEQFEIERQKLIDKVCNEFSNFLEEMKEIWWKGDGCDGSVKSHWLTSFRKEMENAK